MNIFFNYVSHLINSYLNSIFSFYFHIIVAYLIIMVDKMVIITDANNYFILQFTKCLFLYLGFVYLFKLFDRNVQIELKLFISQIFYTFFMFFLVLFFMFIALFFLIILIINYKTEKVCFSITEHFIINVLYLFFFFYAFSFFLIWHISSKKTSNLKLEIFFSKKKNLGLTFIIVSYILTLFAFLSAGPYSFWFLRRCWLLLCYGNLYCFFSSYYYFSPSLKQWDLMTRNYIQNFFILINGREKLMTVTAIFLHFFFDWWMQTLIFLWVWNFFCFFFSSIFLSRLAYLKQKF